MAAGFALDEGDVVIVGTGGTCQDAHEVAVIAEVFKKAGHPPEHATGENKISVTASHHKHELQSSVGTESRSDGPQRQSNQKFKINY